MKLRMEHVARVSENKIAMSAMGQALMIFLGYPASLTIADEYDYLLSIGVDESDTFGAARLLHQLENGDRADLNGMIHRFRSLIRAHRNSNGSYLSTPMIQSLTMERKKIRESLTYGSPVLGWRLLYLNSRIEIIDARIANIEQHLGQ